MAYGITEIKHVLGKMKGEGTHTVVSSATFMFLCPETEVKM